jgi:hypothetical protein
MQFLKYLTIILTKQLSSTLQNLAILSAQPNKRGQWEKADNGKEREFTRGNAAYISGLNEYI